MDKYYEIELALCHAVNGKRDFHHCAEMISGILAPISSSKETQLVMDNLLEFLRTYSPGGTKHE